MDEVDNVIKRQAHIDKLHFDAYNNEHIPVHMRLLARDALRQIKEGTYTWPRHIA